MSKRTLVLRTKWMLRLICLTLWSGAAYALYVPPRVTFITDPGEQQIVLDLSCDSIVSVQSQLDTVRTESPDAVIVLKLSGTCTVTDAPLRLPSRTALLLSGAFQAAPDSTATALISIEGQSKV